MVKTFTCIALSFGVVSASIAQDTPAAAFGGPTMEQTIAFIAAALSDSGAFTAGSTEYLQQSIALTSGCSVLLKNRAAFGTGSAVATYASEGVVDLRQSDLTSLTLDPRSKVGEPEYYTLTLKHAYVVAHKPAPPVQRNVELKAGQPMQELPLEGRLELFRDGVVSILTQEGVIVRYTFSGAPAVVEDKGSGERSARVLATSLTPGDRVRVVPGFVKDKQGGTSGNGSISVTILEKALLRQQEMQIAALAEKDTAERVAKALVHAMVLCHTKDKPSLF